MEYLLLLGKELEYGEEIRFVYILKHSKKEIKKVMSKDGDHLYCTPQQKIRFRLVFLASTSLSREQFFFQDSSCLVTGPVTFLSWDKCLCPKTYVPHFHYKK